MKEISKARFVSVGGMLTTIAVIFQSAPVFFPVVGLVFSPFSTLPIALAAFLNIPLGVSVYVASALILAFIYIQEAIILVFTTGLLGLSIGTFLYRKGMVLSIFFSSILLTLGMLLLTYFLGVAVFGDATTSARIPLTIFLFFAFSLMYAGIWSICLKKFIHYLLRVKALGNMV
ncbi:hypothetical protein ACERII_13085 [Evansella sp. AB-rgal1]|uniref:hypothetical protein n=1 Tax=Evansella sp. AB-rgal1 TaxID=3242696 RepID=UPI00359D7054